MSALTPVVEPLDGSGNLATAAGVDVRVIYTDISTHDTTLVKWGIYDAIRGPGVTMQNPAQLVSIPARHICDGYATAWFSISDAIGNVSYSSVAQVTIATNGAQVLAAPKVAAVNPASPPAGMLVTVADNPAFDLVLAPGDSLTVTWDIYAASGGPSLNHRSETYTLPASTNGSYTTPPLLTIPSGQQYVVVLYTLSRMQAGQAGANGSPTPASVQSFNSASAQASAQSLWPGGGPTQLPAPVFLDAVAGVLDLNAVPPGDIRLQIPATTAIAMTNVDFEGTGRDTGGGEIGNASWTSGFVYVQGTPYQNTPVPRADVEAVPSGGTYSVYYQGAGQTSVATTVTIQRGGAQPPIAGTGQLWGWGDPQWGTLG
jgi:hypothetical protein